MFRGLKIVAMLLVTLFVTEPVFAQSTNFRPKIPNLVIRRVIPPAIRQPTPLLRTAIPPSQAAAIAQGQVPDSKVVKVKLLPGGLYAVTLVTNGKVSKIIVNGVDGSVN